MKNNLVKNAVNKIVELDPWLDNFRSDLELRQNKYYDKKAELERTQNPNFDYTNAHSYFGFHRTENGWYYREWAPNAYALFLVGDFNDWNPESHPLTKLDNGIWEIFISGYDSLKHDSRVKVVVQFNYETHYKLPLFINYVVQEKDEYGNIDWVGKIWNPDTPFKWTDSKHKISKKITPFIYETHIGMAQEEGKIGSYREFADYTLPKIKKAGYDTVQIMAIMQHPFYGSFGYHVSNFFAPSSWFGCPDDLKYLVNKAHEMGINVLIDLVHSHAVKNTNEGINMFDGTQTQFFCEGSAGVHPQWDSMCFNYGKNEVISFLLSNLRYWMEEFHFDGFRFDGVTSMLYMDHSMGVCFDEYSKYFSMNTNLDATTYLSLATELIHSLKNGAIVIAEDVSGMPGLCLPVTEGGIGFDYRLAMGGPDLWIRNMKKNDYDWSMNEIYYELTTKRPGEKKISYAESHDQAIVGDKTIFFWLGDAEIYYHMRKDDNNYVIDRAIALHKMIRFITASTGGDGYLNFMGNEFGHPEWIDFPRYENGWSFHYCRRQWSLQDNPELKYEYLSNFDRDMLEIIKENKVMSPSPAKSLWTDEERKIISYEKNNLIFIFNFHPTESYTGFEFPIHRRGIFKVIFSSDRSEYGGYGRIAENITYKTHTLKDFNRAHGISIYIPARTCLVLKKVK